MFSIITIHYFKLMGHFEQPQDYYIKAKYSQNTEVHIQVVPT